MKLVLKIIGCVVLAAGLAFSAEFAGLHWMKFFRPRYEDVRRETFKRTRSYNEGKEQELLKYRLQYLRASGEDKAAIASTVRHAFADYDETLLTPELQRFLQNIKYGQR